MAMSVEQAGGSDSTLVRQPTRKPLFDEDSNDSFGPSSISTDFRLPMTDTEALMKAKLKYDINDDDEVEIVEQEVDEDEFGDEDVILEEVEVDEIERSNKYRKVSEIIKTAPHMQFKKSASDVKKRDENQLLIVVPPSDNEMPLHERFDKVNNRDLKFSLNSYWATYNYLRRNEENGLKLIANLDDKAKEIAERSGKRKLDTLTGKIAKAQELDKENPEMFWRESLMHWMEMFQWKRRDGPVVTQEELDREIEEYMAFRAASRASGSVNGDIDIDAELADFMERKGIIKEEKDLDDEMDDYWAKKGQIDNGETETEDIDIKAKKKGWSLSTGSLTPQERLRRARSLNTKTNGVAKGTASADELDKQMDLYHARRQHSKEIEEKQKMKEEEEKKAAEAARLAEVAKQSEGDLFADEDFDVYHEAMEM